MSARKPAVQPARVPPGAMALLHQLAATAAPGQPLPTVPKGPDSELLALCEIIVWAASQIEDVRERMLKLPLTAEKDDGRAAIKQLQANITSAVRRARHLPATTGAGLYAKALAIRAAPSGAPFLAQTLADDLLATPSLRAALWPVQAAG